VFWLKIHSHLVSGPEERRNQRPRCCLPLKESSSSLRGLTFRHSFLLVRASIDVTNSSCVFGCKNGFFFFCKRASNFNAKKIWLADKYRFLFCQTKAVDVIFCLIVYAINRGRACGFTLCGRQRDIALKIQVCQFSPPPHP
jgi:hypothetical protein